MLMEILDDFLSHNTTPEIKNIFVEASDVFDILNYDGVDTAYEEVLMTESDRDSSEVISTLTHITTDAMKMCLIRHGVTCVDDVELSMATALMRGIVDLCDYSDKETLIQTLTCGDSSEEILAELLRLTTPYLAEDFLLIFESVSESLIAKIKEIATTTVDESSTIDIAPLIMKVINFLQIRSKWPNIDSQPLIVQQYVDDGLRVGFNFTVYLSLIGDELINLPIDQLVHELILMALISRDGSANPKGIIEKNLESYIHDSQKTLAVTVKVSDVLLKLEQESEKC